MDEVREISETIDELVRAKRHEHEFSREPAFPDPRQEPGRWRDRTPAQVASDHIVCNPLGAAIRSTLFALGVRLAEIGGGELMHQVLGTHRTDDASTPRSAALTTAWGFGIKAWDDYRVTQMEATAWLRHQGLSNLAIRD